MLSRKRIVFVIALTAAISVSTISPAGEVAAPKAENERKLRVRSYQGMPVTLKEVRNLQSDTWYKDLEIEVKNISGKPMYLILAYLAFPDEPFDRRIAAAVTLKFGLSKYIDIRVVGNPMDLHVKPGETCVLKIPEQYWSILRRRQEQFPERLRSFGMGFSVISFGDQTGLTVDGPRDYRNKKSRLHHGR